MSIFVISDLAYLVVAWGRVITRKGLWISCAEEWRWPFGYGGGAGGWNNKGSRVCYGFTGWKVKVVI